MGDEQFNDMGYFGNIWVRSNYLPKKGNTNGEGHRHIHDHVTLLAVGELLVEVEGEEPKKFVAPTFIIIPANNKHKFTALTDGVTYYCVHACRDEDGEVVMFSEQHSPYRAMTERDYLIKILNQKRMERHYKELLEKYGEKSYDKYEEA